MILFKHFTVHKSLFELLFLNLELTIIDVTGSNLYTSLILSDYKIYLKFVES